VVPPRVSRVCLAQACMHAAAATRPHATPDGHETQPRKRATIQPHTHTHTRTRTRTHAHTHTHTHTHARARAHNAGPT
jgi:hypothetical protein